LSDPLARWQKGWPGTRRIVVAGGAASVLGSETKAAIADAGLELVMATLRDPSGNVTPEAAEAEVIISGGTPLDAAVFNALEGARFLLRPYVGYDDIDVDAATARGILVANVPDTFIQEVADHALALRLAANRKLFAMDRFVRDGRWFRGEVAREVAHPMRRLSTMTLGLLGFGNIARLVAARALPFGLRIIAHDPYVPADAATGTGVTMVSREELLRESDILSLHVLLNKETRGMVDASWFAQMKPTAILVNTCRGPVVKEADLIAALEAGRLAGAALDVMEKEPLDPASPLNRMENVVLAPHLASFSDEGGVLHRHRVGQLAAQGARGLPERKVIINKALYDQIVLLPAIAGVPRA
jgi:D-3-phosphoglycerate dehydrogenase